MDIKKLIGVIQEAVGADVDGKIGPQTWTAIAERVAPQQAAALAQSPGFEPDPRSQKNIATLLEQVRPYAVALIQKAAANGITIKIISGLRTYAEQDALYAQGRTTDGPVVTDAKGGESNHNFGTAFDVGVFESNKYLDDSPKYKAVGVLGSDLGLEWGGNWKTIKDQPHFQLRPSWAASMTEGKMLAELRRRVAAHEDVFP
ncbi:MAG: peptidase [Pseudomonas sp.]|nr:peptidase [Pseudomonas sp.]